MTSVKITREEYVDACVIKTWSVDIAFMKEELLEHEVLSEEAIDAMSAEEICKIFFEEFDDYLDSITPVSEETEITKFYDQTSPTFEVSND